MSKGKVGAAPLCGLAQRRRGSSSTCLGRGGNGHASLQPHNTDAVCFGPNFMALWVSSGCGSAMTACAANAWH